MEGADKMTSDDVRDSILKVVRTLDKGIIMERNARDFYTRAARIAVNPKAKKLFEWLARFEISHKARLESKKKEFLSHDSLKGIDLPGLDNYEVSEADPWVTIPEDISEIEILKLALVNEKKAYSFFQKKITFAPDPTIKALFGQLAKEEEKHCQIIEDQLKHIKLNNLWGDIEEWENL